MQIGELLGEYKCSILQTENSQGPFISNDAIVNQYALKVQNHRMSQTSLSGACDHDFVENLVEHLKIRVLHSFLLIVAEAAQVLC